MSMPEPAQSSPISAPVMPRGAQPGPDRRRSAPIAAAADARANAAAAAGRPGRPPDRPRSPHRAAASPRSAAVSASSWPDRARCGRTGSPRPAARGGAEPLPRVRLRAGDANDRRPHAAPFEPSPSPEGLGEDGPLEAGDRAPPPLARTCGRIGSPRRCRQSRRCGCARPLRRPSSARCTTGLRGRPAGPASSSPAAATPRSPPLRCPPSELHHRPGSLPWRARPDGRSGRRATAGVTRAPALAASRRGRARSSPAPRPA